MASRGMHTLSLLLAGLLLAGCSTPIDPNGSQGGPKSAGVARPSVVAVIDSGISPFHEAFRATPGGVRVDDYLDVAPGVALFNASSKLSYEPGKLYAFSGTRVFAISLANTSEGPPIMDEADHGTGTASLVAREDPNALIVMVQIHGDGCPSPPDNCPIYPPLAEALEWVAQQPWIDIVSMSLAPLANTPSSASHPEVARFLAASQLAHRNGKIVIAASGNQAFPPAMQHYGGPPWVINVGGFIPQARGESAVSAKGVDVVANYTEVVAKAATRNETRADAGTSFAAPIVAGVLARALYEVRSSLHHRQGIMDDHALAVKDESSGAPLRLTSKDFWDALNATAVEFAPTDWDSGQVISNGTSWIVDPNLPIIVPAAQMGWGYVHGGLAPAITEWVLSPDHKLPDSKSMTAQVQAQRQAAREAYWQTQVES
jgi:subtilisin family serine protease